MTTFVQPNMIKSFAKLFNISGFIPNYINDHGISTSPGACLDSSKTVIIDSDSWIVKNIVNNWADGGSQAGKPSGITFVAGDTIHKFIIMKANGTIDAGFDTSINAVNLMSDASAYIYHRRVSSFKLDASAHLRSFKATELSGGGYDFNYSSSIQDLSTSGDLSTATLTALSVPIGMELKVIGFASTTEDSGRITCSISSGNKAYDSNELFGETSFDNTLSFSGIYTNTSGQIWYGTNTTSLLNSMKIITSGYTDNRIS